MKYHNLYESKPLPKNKAKLLELSSIFYLQSRMLNTFKFNKIITRFKYDTRIKLFVKNMLGKINKLCQNYT